MNILKRVKKNMKENVDPLDLLNPKNYHNDDRLSQERLNICHQCPHLMAGAVCSQCGCMMQMKVKLTAAKCPIEKW